MPRKNVPLFITMPPAERERLEAYAATIGRPMTWIIRDALRAYLDAVEPLAARIKSPALKAGKTPELKRGRPAKVS